MTEGYPKGGLGRREFLKGTAAASVAAAGFPSFAQMAYAGHKGKTLNAGMIGFSVVNTLDPGKAALNSDFWVIQAMFNALVKFDGDMNIVPDLAESWSNPDPNTWIFNLRQGVKFHDGNELTAEDVVYTIERVQDPATGSPQSGKFKPVESITALDSHTVQFKTASPYVPLLTFLTNTRTSAQIISSKAHKAMGDDGFRLKPIGTGAFMLKEWIPNQKISFEGFDDYFESPMPYVGAVELLLIPEETSGMTALLAGDIDLTSGAPFGDVAKLMETPGIVVARQPGMNYRYCSFNLSRPPFNDPHLRRAISMATDREAIVRAVQFGEGAIGNGAVPPALAWARRSKQREATTFNPDRARAELAKSQYGAGTEAVFLTWGAGWWKRWTEIMVAQSNQILGTKFTIEVTEANTAFQRYKQQDIDAEPTGWIALVDPHEYLFECFHSTGWRNFQKYQNAEVDRLLVEAMGEFDKTARGDLYKAAEDLIVEDCPCVFVMHSNAHNLWRDDITGFVARPDQAYGSGFAAVQKG